MSEMTRRDAMIAAYLFLFLLSVYWLTYSGTLHCIDEASTLSMTESLVKEGKLTTDQLFWTRTAGLGWLRVGVDGHLYSPHSFLHALSIAPLYAIGLRWDGLGAMQMALLYSPFITAATAAALYVLVRQLGYSAGVALVISLIFGLTTPAWVYAKFLFKDSLIALALTLAAMASVSYSRSGKRVGAILAGLFMGLGFMTRPTVALTIPFFLGYIVLANPQGRSRNSRFGKAVMASLLFLVPLFLALSLQGFCNAIRFVSPWNFGLPLGAGFQTPLWAGLYGLFLSPEKGLLLYSPTIALGIWGFVPFARRHLREGLLVGLSVVVYVSVHAMYHDWAGGLAWGPRYLVGLLPLLVLPAAPVIEVALSSGRRWRLVIIGLLGALSFVVQLLGVGINYLSAAKVQPPPSPLESLPPSLDFSRSPLLWQLQAWRPESSDLAILRSNHMDIAILLPGLIIVTLLLIGLAKRWRRAAPQPLTEWGSAGLCVLAAGSLFALMSFSLPRYYDEGGYFADMNLARLLLELPKHTHEGDGLLSLVPFQYATFLNYYKDSAPHYGLALQRPSLDGPTEHLLHDVVLRHPRVWLLSGQDVASPESGVDEWLSRHAYKASDGWQGDYRLALYATGHEPMTRASLAVNFSNTMVLDEAAYAAGPLRAGDVAPVALRWRALVPITQNLTVFLHLDDDKGRGWAGRDSPPSDGYRPTSTWSQGEVVEDRRGLVLPQDLPPGEYRLVVGLYEPKTLERLALQWTDDSAIEIGTVRVQAP